MENNFIDQSLMMAYNFHWSMEDILEMPASRWIVIQERWARIQRRMEREMKRKSKVRRR